MADSDLLQCPYEISHRILPSRFQVHLVRCSKNHKNVPKVTCPFNVTHILNKPELNYHVTVCPERASFEKFKLIEEPATKNVVEPKLMGSALPHEQTENWDDEPDAPTYNPAVYAENAKILRSIQGATPSERKEFRKQERKRLLGIKH